MIDTAKKYIQVFPKICMVGDARDAYHKVLYKLLIALLSRCEVLLLIAHQAWKGL